MRNALVLGVMLFGALATAQVDLSAQARWLDQPLKSWNQPAAGVPVSPITADGHASLQRRCGAANAGTSAVSGALRGARWTPFLYLDQAIASNDIEVIGGMTGATTDCEPMFFNLFVFVGGKFAGTLSPTRMTPSRDGVAGAVRITGVDTMTVEFARYLPDDPACCPSSRMRVSYSIDRTGAGPTLVATDTRQVR